MVLSALCPEIAPPLINANENVKFEYVILALSLYKAIAPPSPNAREDTNEELNIVIFVEFTPANIVPPFTAIESINVVLAIKPLGPTQSIAPP